MTASVIRIVRDLVKLTHSEEREVVGEGARDPDGVGVLTSEGC